MTGTCGLLDSWLLDSWQLGWEQVQLPDWGHIQEDEAHMEVECFQQSHSNTVAQSYVNAS